MTLGLSSLIEKAEVTLSENRDWRNKSVEFVYGNTLILIYLGLHSSLPDTDEYPVYKIYKMVEEKKEVIFDTRKLIKGQWANISEKEGKVIITIKIKYGDHVKVANPIDLDGLIKEPYSAIKVATKSNIDTKPSVSPDAESVKDFITKAFLALNVSEINIGEILIDEEGIRIQDLRIFFDK